MNDYDIDALAAGFARAPATANGKRAGPGAGRPAWQIKLDKRLKLMQNGRPEREKSWVELEMTRMKFTGGCKPIPLPTIKGESQMLENLFPDTRTQEKAAIVFPFTRLMMA